jgi:hypothetical protein
MAVTANDGLAARSIVRVTGSLAANPGAQHAASAFAVGAAAILGGASVRLPPSPMVEAGLPPMELISAHDLAEIDFHFGLLSILPRPLSAPAATHCAWLRSDDISAAWNKLCREHGFVAVHAGYLPWLDGIATSPPLCQTHSVRGRRAISAGLGRDILTALGADAGPAKRNREATSLPPDDPGTVICDWSAGVMPPGRLDGVQPAPHVRSIEIFAAPVPLVVRMDVKIWDRLTASTQTAMSLLAEALSRQSLSNLMQDERARRRADPWAGQGLRVPLRLLNSANSVATAIVADLAGRTKTARMLNRQHMAALDWTKNGPRKAFS